MGDELADAIILNHLKRKGYVQAENALKKESKVLGADDFVTLAALTSGSRYYQD